MSLSAEKKKEKQKEIIKDMGEITMGDKESLSKKEICVGDVKLGTLNSDLSYYVYQKEDVKEKIQKVQKRIKEEIDNWMRDLGIFDSAELVNIPDVMDLRKKINKIFKEEFGEKLMQSLDSSKSTNSPTKPEGVGLGNKVPDCIRTASKVSASSEDACSNQKVVKK